MMAVNAGRGPRRLTSAPSSTVCLVWCHWGRVDVLEEQEKASRWHRLRTINESLDLKDTNTGENESKEGWMQFCRGRWEGICGATPVLVPRHVLQHRLPW